MEKVTLKEELASTLLNSLDKQVELMNFIYKVLPENAYLKLTFKDTMDTGIKTLINNICSGLGIPFLDGYILYKVDPNFVDSTQRYLAENCTIGIEFRYSYSREGVRTDLNHTFVKYLPESIAYENNDNKFLSAIIIDERGEIFGKEEEEDKHEDNIEEPERDGESSTESES